MQSAAPSVYIRKILGPITNTQRESQLQALLESAKLLNASLNLDEVLRHLLRTAMGRLLASRGLIAVRRNGKFTVALSRGLRDLPSGAEFPRQALPPQLALFFDIGDPADPIGVLALGTPARGAIEQDERDFLDALLGLAASCIDNAQAHDQAVSTNLRLDEKVQELRALLDLVRGIAGSLQPNEIAQMLVLTLSGRWLVPKYGLVTWKPDQTPISRCKGLDLGFVQSQPNEWSDFAEPKLAPNDPRFPPGSILFPLRGSGDTFGLVVCGPRLNRQSYTESDLEFGGGLVAQAAVSFDNAWHFQDTLVRQQMEKEVALAASIQRNLFPAAFPPLARSDIAARNRQAKQVGGDYYDAIPIGLPGPVAPHLLCVVDISGKGLFAALLMSNIQATLRALLSREPSLGALTIHTNDLLHATTPSNRYATAFLAKYEPASGHCRWVNCGHNDGIVLRASGEVEMLACSGLALGLFAGRVYEEQSFDLAPGDLLAIYSDGVTEANNIKEEEYSTERLIEMLRAHRERPAAEIVSEILDDIDRFVGAAPQFDDITLLVIRRTL